MRKLYLDNGNEQFKFADTTTKIIFNALDNGIPAELTADTKVRIKNESGYLLEVSASITNGQAVITSGQLAQLPVGSYLIELWDTANGGTAIYPSDGFLRLQINENVAGLSGNIVSSITVDDFIKQFSGLSQELRLVQKNQTFTFQPSRDGFPNYDTATHVIDFRCITDSAQITLQSGVAYQIPHMAKVEVNWELTTGVIIFDINTLSLISQTPYIPINANQYVLASYRRYPDEGDRLAWNGVLAQNLLIDWKSYTKHSVIYQQSTWCRLTYDNETGLDFGVVDDSKPHPYVYLDCDNKPALIPIGTKAVFDQRSPNYRGSWKVTWKVGTSDAILTPCDFPNVPGYVTLFSLTAHYINGQVVRLKTSIGEPVYFGLKNPDNDNVMFVPSKDGLPYYDSKRKIINFNCLTDQAYIIYENLEYTLPLYATVSLDLDVSTSRKVLMDLETRELSTIKAFDTGYSQSFDHTTIPQPKLTQYPNKIVIATVRSLNTGKVVVEGFKLLDEVSPKKCAGIIPIAHRGLNSIAPEESLEAYSLAVRSGYNDIECDVHFTKDDIPVLHHDDSINRIARNDDGTNLSETINIAEKSYEELLAFDYGIYKSEIFKGNGLLRFQDFVDFGRKTGAKLHVELKNHYTDEQCQTLLAIAYANRITSNIGWQAFDHSSLDYIANNDENAQLELLSGSLTDELISEGQNWINGKRKVVLSVGLATVEGVQKAHTYGFDVYVWAIDNLADAKKYIDMGVDAIMTNGYVDLPNLLSNNY